MFLPRKVLEEKLRRFLEEDLGQGDVTTALAIPEGTVVEAEVVAEETGTVAGLEETRVFLESFGLKAEVKVSDGVEVRPRTVLLRVTGDARTLLSLERTLLNLLSRMSGIATTTRRILRKLREAGYTTRVACTRKVAPGLSFFDKKAVLVGGGDVHRLRLDDMILIKDNHIATVGDLEETVGRVRERASFSKKIEVEVSNLEDAVKAAEMKADIIMLDNFTPRQIRKTLKALEKKKLRSNVMIEASGGINEENVLEFAATGVDVVSLGELTQHVKSMNISLEVVKVHRRKD
ncbi:MAG TPA: carboxylating nicotinate-nucleotide diphosphorylase [Candidatus Krumholzibacteriaceae bacterium]|nr:carboxylating nicotinate-nucleotide diphosphorylase [Candidatus Krumholzibacteriaceae bacterium]